MSERIQPRQEAGIIAAADLTDDQKAALEKIVGYLSQIAEAPFSEQPKDSWSRFVPMVDKERTNHVFLINGERGSGKSALLLTLLHIWSETLRKGKPPEEYELQIAPRPIVPVGLIDLQPLHSSTNLLLHLVGQLGRLADVLGEELSPGKVAHPAKLWEETSEPESVRARRKLMHVATAAWSGGMDARAQKLSLEERAVELDHAERRRFDLHKAFRELVDALAKDYCAWQRLDPSSHAPLFVIAIDDADMNPQRSRELLDLIRTLWHARVAYVLTGHRELFLDTIERDLVKKPNRLKRPRVARAALARNIYDKIIPEPHHCGLPQLSWRDRINALRRALEPEPSPAIKTILALLAANEQSADAIPGRLRGIQDLAQMMRNSGQSIPNLIFCFLQHAKSETGGELPYGYDLYGEGDRRQLSIYAEHLSWSLDWYRYVELPVGDGERIEALTSARLRMARTNEDTSGYGRLSRAAGIALLAGDAEKHGIRVHSGPIAKTFWIRTWIGEIQVPWLLPSWQRIELVSRATSLWFEATKHAATPHGVETAAWFAAVYLSCNLHIAGIMSFAEEELAKGLHDELLDEDGSIRWQHLAGMTAELAIRVEAPMLAKWARTQAPLLAAPESGLPARDANCWLEAFRSEVSRRLGWDEIASAIKSARRIRMNRPDAVSGWAAEVYHRLDRDHGDHIFAQVVDDDLDITAPLKNAMECLRFPIVPGVETDNRQPQNIHTMLWNKRKRNLSFAPSQLQDDMKKVLDKYDGLRGITQKALYDLWRVMAEHYHEHVDADFIRWHGDRIEMQLQCDVQPVNGAPKVFSLGEGVEIQLFRAGYPTIKNVPESLPKSLDAVMRLIFDAMVDELDKEEEAGLDAPSEWQCLKIRAQGVDRHLPAPPWGALVDWEICCERWNEIIIPIADSSLRGDVNFGENLYSRILSWYLDATMQLYRLRHIDTSYDLGIAPGAWETLGREISKVNGEFEREKKERVTELLVNAKIARELGQEEQAAERDRKAAAYECDPFSLISSRRKRAFLEWANEIKKVFTSQAQDYCIPQKVSESFRQGVWRGAPESADED